MIFDIVFCDVHCHLTDRTYKTEIDELLTRCTDVKYLITCGVDLSDSERALELAKRFDRVFVNIGVHPHDADNFKKEDWERFRKLAKEEKVKGIGEIGLDFYKNYSNPQIQKEVFAIFVELAKELSLPMNIHLRKAHEEGLAILKEINYFNGCLHAFSGDSQIAQEAIEKGLYISVSGVITYDAFDLKKVIKNIPLDRLLIETDSPYLAPVPFRGKRNEPAYLKYTANYLSDFLGVSKKELARITQKNSCKLFDLPK